MLDKLKLAHELSRVAQDIFTDNKSQLDLVRSYFERVAADPSFSYQAQYADRALNLPHWSGLLNATIPITPWPEPYTIISVDGSQIYPDRHSGFSCFLINTGSVVLRYGYPPHEQAVYLESQPYLFAGSDYYQESVSPHEWVNCRRQEFEFRNALEHARAFPALNTLTLLDGSLIFWHLEAKDTALRDAFLATYLALLDGFYRDNLACASYISAPKSRELVNLIKYAMSLDGIFEGTEGIADVTVARFFLPPHHRTSVFKNNASISEYYCPALRPHFFYMNTGEEMGRVEIPGYVAQNETLVNMIASLVDDQCAKGYGYPVVIAEAHEQAVVKSADREFFYYMLEQEALKMGKLRSGASYKSLRKKYMGV
jgi:hypothetical protein